MSQATAIPDAVRAEMARRRLTQADVAEALGISQRAVSRRLRGDVPLKAEEVVSLAALLDVEPSELLKAAS